MARGGRCLLHPFQCLHGFFVHFSMRGRVETGGPHFGQNVEVGFGRLLHELLSFPDVGNRVDRAGGDLEKGDAHGMEDVYGMGGVAPYLMKCVGAMLSWGMPCPEKRNVWGLWQTDAQVATVVK